MAQSSGRTARHGGAATAVGSGVSGNDEAGDTRSSTCAPQGGSGREDTRVSPAPYQRMSGGVLLSHTLPSAVPSALKGLATGFGMEPGVSPTL